MTARVERFPYMQMDPGLGPPGALPYLPITLALREETVSVRGLVDSGAALNVLPYHVGVQLGAVWDEQTVVLRLGGNLAKSEARGIFLRGGVGQFAPTKLAFAWTRDDSGPVILGQVNFFTEFDVCFFRSRGVFEIKDHSPGD